MAERLFAQEEWHAVVLVEYPSRQAFVEMVASAEYAAFTLVETMD